MINPAIIGPANLSPGEVAAFSLCGLVYQKHPDKWKKVLDQHEQVYLGDPASDVAQIISLSKDRGRYFTEDFDGMLNDLHFNSLGDFWDKLKSGAGKILGSDLVSTAAGVGANIFAPGTGGIASNIVDTLGDKLSGGPPAGAEPGFEWPKESEFPQQAWVNLINNSSASKSDLQAALDRAKFLVTEYQRQTDYHTANNHPQNANSTALWRDRAKEFVSALTNRMSSPPDKKTEQLVKDIFTDKSGADLDDRSASKDLKNKMEKDTNDESSDDKILGLEKKTFWMIAIPVIILIVALIVWLIMRYRKKKLAQKNGGQLKAAA